MLTHVRIKGRGGTWRRRRGEVREMVGDGGRWWEMVGDGGRLWEIRGRSAGDPREMPRACADVRKMTKLRQKTLIKMNIRTPVIPCLRVSHTPGKGMWRLVAARAARVELRVRISSSEIEGSRWP